MDRKLRFIPISQFDKVKDGDFSVYVDYWWIITKNKEVVVFGKSSLQCNKDKRICEMVMKNSYPSDQYDLIQIPVMYIPLNVRDFDYDLT